jgi:transglutaminase-like putative cysteine protease
VYGGYDVYVYPIRASRERIRALFLEMLARANALATRPEFYNTLTNNCTSNVVDHVNHIVPRAVPHGISTILPGYADGVAYSLGLIDNSISLDEARRRFRVKDGARRFVKSPDFSRRIRVDTTTN